MSKNEGKPTEPNEPTDPGNTEGDGETPDPKLREKFLAERASGSGLTSNSQSGPHAINSSLSLSPAIAHVLTPYIPGENFRVYEDRLKQYFIAYNIEEKNKVPIFITIVGAEIYEILLSLTGLEFPSEKTFEELITLLRNHFIPKINKSSERAKFVILEIF